MDFEDLRDIPKEEIEGRLILSAVNYADNRKSLAALPVVQKGEIALFVQMLTGEKNQYGVYTECCSVTEEMRQSWGINRNILFSKAAENSKYLYPGELKPLSDYVNNTAGMIMPDGQTVPDVYVLSNAYHFQGTATMFYAPELLDELGRSLKKDHIVLMPTGADESFCIALGEKADLLGYQVLFDEVRENMEHSALTQNVMEYDVKTQLVEDIGGETFTLDVDDTPQLVRGRGR